MDLSTFITAAPCGFIWPTTTTHDAVTTHTSLAQVSPSINWPGGQKKATATGM